MHDTDTPRNEHNIAKKNSGEMASLSSKASTIQPRHIPDIIEDRLKDMILILSRVEIK